MQKGPLDASGPLVVQMIQNGPLAVLAPLVVVSHSTINENYTKYSFGYLGSSCGRSLLNSELILIQNAPLTALAAPVAVSSSSLNQIECKMLLWLPCLLL